MTFDICQFQKIIKENWTKVIQMESNDTAIEDFDESWPYNSDILFHMNIGNNFESSKELCTSFGKGQLFYPKTEVVYQKMLLHYSNKGGYICIWTPLTEEKENEFKDIYTGERISFLPWEEGEPSNYNGQENCAILVSFKKIRTDKMFLNLECIM